MLRGVEGGNGYVGKLKDDPPVMWEANLFRLLVAKDEGIFLLNLQK